MLLTCCGVSFAGLLSSSSPVTPVVSKEYKQQLPAHRSISDFKEERTLILYVKMGEQIPAAWIAAKIWQLFRWVRTKRRQQAIFKKSGRPPLNQPKPDSRFISVITIGFPNAYDRARAWL